jgi:hypothetical protein
VLVEVDVSDRPKDHIDHDVVPESLEDPMLVRPLGRESRSSEGFEQPIGVDGSDENVDIVRPPRSAQRSRPDTADQDVIDSRCLDGRDGFGEDLGEDVFRFRLALEATSARQRDGITHAFRLPSPESP